MIDAYFMLSGRIRRFKFLGYSILLWIVIFLLALLCIPLVGNARYPTLATVSLTILLALFWIWACTALVVKRLHDLNKPGWHALWMIVVPSLLSGTFSLTINGVPLAGEWGLTFGFSVGSVILLSLLYLVLASGSDGPNSYGYPP